MPFRVEVSKTSEYPASMRDEVNCVKTQSLQGLLPVLTGGLSFNAASLRLSKLHQAGVMKEDRVELIRETDHQEIETTR